MDQFQIIMMFLGVVVLSAIGAQYYFQYTLKKYERDLWESFGRLSSLNASGYLSSIWYVLSGKYRESSNDVFIWSCKLYRSTMILLIIAVLLVFVLWPMTWELS